MQQALALILSAVDTENFQYQIALHFAKAFCYFLASKSKTIINYEIENYFLFICNP